MNEVRSIMVTCSREEEGLWDVITEIAQTCGISRSEAFERLRREVDFLESRDDIYLVRSLKLYSSVDCEVIDKKELASLPQAAAEFNENGPFYYLSNVPGI